MGENAALRTGKFEKQEWTTSRIVLDVINRDGTQRFKREEWTSRHVVPKRTQNSEEEVTCSICFATFDEKSDDWIFRRCGHAFHKKCLAGWGKQGRRECPLCRRVGVEFPENPRHVYTLQDDFINKLTLRF